MNGPGSRSSMNGLSDPVVAFIWMDGESCDTFLFFYDFSPVPPHFDLFHDFSSTLSPFWFLCVFPPQVWLSSPCVFHARVCPFLSILIFFLNAIVISPHAMPLSFPQVFPAQLPVEISRRSLGFKSYAYYWSLLIWTIFFNTTLE
jgi:hypothetical protein